MKIADEENQPNPFKRQIPKRVFPYQMPADIEQTFDKNTEYGIGNRPKPGIGQSQDFFGPVFRERVVEDDAGNGKHKHDFNIPSDHGAQRGGAGGGPK